jgi:hypothetical protein
MEELCGTADRNASNDALNHRTIGRRFESLDAIYAQQWDRVNNLRGEEPMLGVHPTLWPQVSRTRRWYQRPELEAARASWAALGAASARS